MYVWCLIKCKMFLGCVKITSGLNIHFSNFNERGKLAVSAANRIFSASGLQVSDIRFISAKFWQEYVHTCWSCVEGWSNWSSSTIHQHSKQTCYVMKIIVFLPLFSQLGASVSIIAATLTNYSQGACWQGASFWYAMSDTPSSLQVTLAALRAGWYRCERNSWIRKRPTT